MMAAGKRPVPFRTRKLSPPAPMVLPPGGSGRVGYRRPNNFTHSTRHKHLLAAGAFSYTNACCRLLVGVRIADNPTPTNNWCAPTDCTNQHNTPTDAKPTWGNATSPSIRAQPVPRMASSSPSNACGLTHCGQPHPHPSLVHTHETSPRRPRCGQHTGTHHWRQPPHCGQRRRRQQWVDTNGPAVR